MQKNNKIIYKLGGVAYKSFWNQSKLFHGEKPLELTSFSNLATREFRRVSSPTMTWMSIRGENGLGKETGGGERVGGGGGWRGRWGERREREKGLRKKEGTLNHF